MCVCICYVFMTVCIGNLHAYVSGRCDIVWHAITDKDSMVDNAVLMDPPSSGKLLKTASFTDEGTL